MKLSVTDMFEELTDEYKQEVANTLQMYSDMGITGPDTYGETVRYYWTEQQRKPAGWFTYWD